MMDDSTFLQYSMVLDDLVGESVQVFLKAIFLKSLLYKILTFIDFFFLLQSFISHFIKWFRFIWFQKQTQNNGKNKSQFVHQWINIKKTN